MSAYSRKVTMNRRQILNPHNNDYHTHIHEYMDSRNITYRCGHTETTYIEYCNDINLEIRADKLSKLLCVSCETAALERIKREYE